MVLDEARTMPLALLKPCVAVLQELARSYGLGDPVCAATQTVILQKYSTDLSEQPHATRLGGRGLPRKANG